MSAAPTLPDDGPPMDPDDELLVAYLDGELDNQERDELEQRLIDDESLRVRLQSLQVGWDWLDDLPVTSSNEKLVESTLELVVDDILKKAPKKQKKQRPKWLFACAAAVASGLIVYGAIAWARAQHMKKELADLGLAETLDAYEYGGDLTFMRDLEANRSWTSTMKRAHEVGVLAPVAEPLVATTPVSARPDAIAEMSIDDRAYLEARWARFQQMVPERQQRIRRTAAAVQEKADTESLIAVMKDYALWYASLPQELQDSLDNQDAKIRDKAVADAIEVTRQRITHESGKILSEEDVETIYIGLETFLHERLAENPELSSLANESANHNPMTKYFLVRRMIEPQSRGRGPGPGPGPPLRRITPQELLLLSEQLSDDAKSHLDAILSLGTLDIQQSLLIATMQDWVETAFNRRFRRNNDVSLLDWYRSLNANDRDTIDLLSPENMKREMDRRRFRGSGGFSRRPPRGQ